MGLQLRSLQQASDAGKPTHHSALHHVHWGTDTDCKETCSTARSKMAGQGVLEETGCYKGLLDLQCRISRMTPDRGMGVSMARNVSPDRMRPAQQHSQWHYLQQGNVRGAGKWKPATSQVCMWHVRSSLRQGQCASSTSAEGHSPQAAQGTHVPHLARCLARDP